MSQPKRFREGGGGEIGRLVVRSGIGEAPPPEVRRRVEAAIGLGAAVSATASSAAAGTAGATGAAGATKTAQAGLVLGFSKWGGVAVITAVVGGGVGTYALVTGGSFGEAPPAASASAVLEATRAIPPPKLVAPPLAASAAPVEPAPSTQPSAAMSMSMSATAPAKPAPTLGDELRMLDEARAAMNGGDTGRAIALLDQHDRDFRGGGALAPEAMALRIEAYARRGDRDAAARLGARFLALYGDTPQAQRVRSILEASGPANP